MQQILNFCLAKSNHCIATISFGLVFVAYLFEIIGGYEPCPLCLFQRWCFMGMGFMALLRIIIGEKQIGVFPVVGIWVFGLGGFAIAARQIYLQHLPKELVPSCAPPMDFLMDALPFTEVLSTILLADGNCAEEDWRFIFNFAEWAALGFLCLTFFSIASYFIRKGSLESRL
ncbi:MAG: disulfide bond formation protein B [Gammaproteobacteria bacterium]